MANLFDLQVPAINKHLNNIYSEEELNKSSTISKMETVQKEGNRELVREIEYYKLDAIISLEFSYN